MSEILYLIEANLIAIFVSNEGMELFRFFLSLCLHYCQKGIRDMDNVTIFGAWALLTLMMYVEFARREARKW